MALGGSSLRLARNYWRLYTRPAAALGNDPQRHSMAEAASWGQQPFYTIGTSPYMFGWFYPAAARLEDVIHSSQMAS